MATWIWEHMAGTLPNLIPFQYRIWPIESLYISWSLYQFIRNWVIRSVELLLGSQSLGYVILSGQQTVDHHHSYYGRAAILWNDLFCKYFTTATILAIEVGKASSPFEKVPITISRWQYNLQGGISMKWSCKDWNGPYIQGKVLVTAVKRGCRLNSAHTPQLSTTCYATCLRHTNMSKFAV